ncbi:MAG: M14 family zinc carboxypeptidase, partial [Thermoplasmatota archaeon]
MQKKARFLVLIACLILVLSIFSSGSIDSLKKSNDHINMENSTDDLNQEGVYPFENEYPSVQQLNDWYDTLVNDNSNITKKIHLGQSWEGRDTWVIKVSDDVEEEQDEPSVFIHGNQHAREWSTSQAAAYYLWRLVEDYGSNETITWLVDNRQIYVAPMVNPDGYIYDGDGDLNQAAEWRKNRNDSTSTDYVGVDLNRNWDIDWESGDDDPASATYHGENPFSEYETQNLRDFILSKNIDSYQDIHSHYGTLLIPWAHTSASSPHDAWYREMAGDMTSMTSFLGDDSQQYSYGQPEDEIGYSAPGGAYDWAYNETGAIGLCYELYTPDDGMDGFYPAEQYIMDINLDVYDSLVYQARIADIDLGDGSDHLYPPSPYLVYGTVEDDTGEIVDGVELSVVNHNTNETIYTQTDRNGYYEFNFGNLVENGYDEGDTFSIEVADTSEEFTVGSEWGVRKDMVVNSITPSIDVTRPMGGETWEYGNIEAIEWITEEGDNPIDSVDLEYSIDGGSSYIDIMTGLDDTGSYDWDVPDVTSDEVVIQATVHDTGGLSGSDSSSEFTILGTPPEPSENLHVEHSGTVGEEEIITNGTFPDNYDPWTLTEVQAEDFAGWDEASYEEGGSIHVSAQQDGDGVTTEEAHWEQDIGPTSDEITVNAAYRKNIVEDSGDCNVDITIELLVQDTDTGWESIYIDQDSTVGDSGWLDFGPDATYMPTGEVNAVRAYM